MRFQQIRRYYFTLFLWMGVVTLIHGQAGIKTYFDQRLLSESGLHVQAISQSEFRLTFILPCLEISEQTFANSVYHRLGIPGAGYYTEVGMPSLPEFQGFLDAACFTDVKTEVVEMDTVSLPFIHVIPSQAAILRNKPIAALSDRLTINQLFYEGQESFPSGFFNLNGYKSIGSKRVLDLRINPVLFFPEGNRILVVRKITLNVKFQESSNNLKLKKSDIQTVNDGFSQPFVFSFGKADTLQKKPFRLLVVTHDLFYDSIKPFIDWKKRKGNIVSVLKISQIGKNPSDSMIKKVLQDSFDAGRLQYVLLVGDNSFIPAFSGVRNALNDHGYTTLQDTDYLPDIVIGRFSVNSPAECGIYCRKLIRYEKYPDTITDYHWYQRATSAASNAHLDDWHGRDVVHFFKQNNFTEVDDLRASLNRFNGINILNALDSGRSWFFYIGHGTSAGLTVDGGFGNYEVQHLNNFRKLTAVVSVACANADFDNPGSCLGETFMNVSDSNGASVFLGATEDTYFFWSDTLGKYAMFSYIDGETETFGDAMNYGKLKMYQCFPQNNKNSESEETMQHFMILGDPTIMPWTRRPQGLVLNKPIKIDSDSLLLSVTSAGKAVSNALIGLTNKDFTFSKAAYTNSDGQVLFSGGFPKSGTLIIVVSGRNMKPLIDSVKIDSGNSNNEISIYKVSIYPNPFNDFCRIKFANGHPYEKAVVIGLDGRIERSYDVSNSSELRISREGLANGVYLLRISGRGKAVMNKKLVIF